MSVEQEKAALFVSRLWENPSLSGLSPLQKEEQLQQFLKINSSTLQPTLSSDKYFAGKPWVWIYEILSRELSRMANQSLQPLYDTLIDKKLGFSFVQHMAHKSSSPSAVKSQFGDFLKKLASKTEARRELTGPLIGSAGGIVDRYIMKVFERQKYISFEIRKVQRLKISSNEVAELVIASMLLRPAIPYFNSSGSGALAGRTPVIISPAYALKVIEDTSHELEAMPDTVIRCGINSALSFQDNPYLESTARLAAVFSHRCRNLRPGMKIDRGAETSDKSWFSVARKNYKFYGFDLDMLVELHGIAAENGW